MLSVFERVYGKHRVDLPRPRVILSVFVITFIQKYKKHLSTIFVLLRFRPLLKLNWLLTVYKVLDQDRDSNISRSRSYTQFPPEIAIRGHSSGLYKPSIGIRAAVLTTTMVNNGDHAPSGFKLGISLSKPHLLLPGELSW